MPGGDIPLSPGPATLTGSIRGGVLELPAAFGNDLVEAVVAVERAVGAAEFELAGPGSVGLPLASYTPTHEPAGGNSKVASSVSGIVRSSSTANLPPIAPTAEGASRR